MIVTMTVDLTCCMKKSKFKFMDFTFTTSDAHEVSTDYSSGFHQVFGLFHQSVT